MATPNMRQAATQIRKWWEGAKPVAAWVKGHAAAAMGVTLLLIAAGWLREHDARVRREAELGVMRREVTSEVSALRQRAEAAIKESRASERAIRDLETRRTVLEREASVLRARLNSLREEDRLRARPAITPGHNEAAGNAKSRPGPARLVDRGWRLATRDSEPGNDLGDSKLETVAALNSDPRPGEGQPRANDLPVSNFQFPVSTSAFPSPVSCGEQADLQDRLIANCEERAELNRAALEAAKNSARELGEALRARDAMAARLEEQHRAELKVVRGSRLHRFGRALQYVGVGVVIGMAVAL